MNGSDNFDMPPGQPGHDERLERDALDQIDDAVAGITGEDIEDGLSEVLRQAGYGPPRSAAAGPWTAGRLPSGGADDTLPAAPDIITGALRELRDSWARLRGEQREVHAARREAAAMMAAAREETRRARKEADKALDDAARITRSAREQAGLITSQAREQASQIIGDANREATRLEAMGPVTAVPASTRSGGDGPRAPLTAGPAGPEPHRSPHKVPCSEILEQVYYYLDHETSDADCEDIREHLDECVPCLREFGLEELVKKLVAKHCGCDPAPAGLRSKVLVRARPDEARQPDERPTGATPARR
jgi:mycothiol system anti-sigma-R factor